MSANSNADDSRPDVLIIGGGVSGLAAAYFLSQAGQRCVLVEKAPRLGGLIKTDLIDGCELEAGPDSFIASKTAVAQLARKLGIDDQIIGSNDERRRIFIVREGKLIPMPRGMVMMVPGDLGEALRSELFSSQTKFRFVQELFFAPGKRESDVSLREFVTDHFGEEALEYLTEPLLAGVYGGDSAALSTASVLPRFLEYERNYGSLIRGVRAQRAQPSPHASLFLSFRGGMQTLIDALARAVSTRVTVTTAEASRIERHGDHWRVYLEGGGSIDATETVLACPAYVNARLLRAASPILSQELASIPYSSAILATLLYDRSELEHPLDGFGFLVPKRERRGVTAATWISTKFPSRTRPGRAALRAFLVGEDAIHGMNRSDGELISMVQEEFKRLMNVAAQPVSATVYRWPDSMPQYVVGHSRRQAAIRELTRELPGLHICGNAYDGVGIPDCVRLASEVSRAILHPASALA